MTRYIDVKNVRTLLGGFVPMTQHGPADELLDRLLQSVNDDPTVNRRYDLHGLGQAELVPNPRKGLIDHIHKCVRANKPIPRVKTLVWTKTYTEQNSGVILGRKDADMGVVEREGNEPLQWHIIQRTPAGDGWSIIVPIHFLMRGFKLNKKSCHGYAHGININSNSSDNTEADKRLVYCGITQRNWLTRLREHIRGIQHGERKKFYNTWRAVEGNNKSTFTAELCHVNLTYDEVMAWEESAVNYWMERNQSLNMIPGGFAGIKYLHKLGIQGHPRSVSARNKILEEFERSHGTAGVPNLALAKRWQDEEYAASMICNEKLGRLTPDKVIRVRQLGFLGVPAEEIAKEVDARSIEQVQNIIDNKTYTRIF